MMALTQTQKIIMSCYVLISGRDTVDHDDEELLEELFLSLVHNYDGSDTDSEDEDFLNFMGYVVLAECLIKVRKRAKIRNRYNQAPHLTQVSSEESQ